jgi:hypothetical protein
VARIDVLTDRPIGLVDRRIFGSITEHLGRCVYGGVFDEGCLFPSPSFPCRRIRLVASQGRRRPSVGPG